MSGLSAVLAWQGLPSELESPLARLLEALAAEPDPHTTVADPAAAAQVHVADSLSALAIPELRSAVAIADVGAGAGFPGLPLAVALPDARIDLIESAGRKIAVVEQLIEAAGIPNARGLTARAEDWAGAEGAAAYDVVTVRAVGPLSVLAEYSAPLLREGGLMVAWKGRRDEEEELAGSTAAEQLGLEARQVLDVEPYPGSRNRHLHVYRKLRPTPAGYPRRAGMAAKRPLG